MSAPFLPQRATSSLVLQAGGTESLGEARLTKFLSTSDVFDFTASV